MSGAKFMMIQLPRRTKVDEEKIRPVLDKALDWIEISPNSWIVWTSSSPERWYSRIKKSFGEKTRIFICSIDASERHGWMPKEFWNFLNKDRA